MLMATILASAILVVPAPAIVPADGTGPQVRESQYTGKYYRARWESWRKCVVWRESRDNEKAANRHSSARGTYQFLDNAWRVSLTHMVMREHKDQRDTVKDLRRKPIHQWPRYWQDAAFWTVLNNGKGAHHWSYGSSCERWKP